MPALKRANIRLSDVHKFVADDGSRRITGIASSISVDRMGDIVVPSGGSWTLPVPLLFQHSQTDAIGRVTKAQVRGDAIVIEAQLAKGVGRADEVWSLIQQDVLDSFSIGFRSIKSEPLPNGGLRFTQWELLEISVVAVPAQAAAKISRGRTVVCSCAVLAPSGSRNARARCD